MRSTMKWSRSACWLLALVACAAFSGMARGADLSKCLDRAGLVTYSSESCESQGLKPAGPIRDRTTVVPGAVPAARKTEPAKDGKAKDPMSASSELGGSPVQIKPINPLIERLLK